MGSDIAKTYMKKISAILSLKSIRSLPEHFENLKCQNGFEGTPDIWKTFKVVDSCQSFSKTWSDNFRNVLI